MTGDDPVVDSWSRLAEMPLSARMGHLLVATDSGLLAWGGEGPEGTLTDGAFLDLTTGAWRSVPEAPLAANRGDAVGVWTGSEVIVVNGVQRQVRAAAFDPVTFTWRSVDAPPVDNAANAMSRVAYVGGTVALWSTTEDGTFAGTENTLVVLNVEDGSWSTASAPPVALASGASLVTAGDELYVVGRHDNSEGCWTLQVLRYAPATDTWTEVDAGPVSNHADVTVAWTGSELFVGGGATCEGGVNDGVPSTAAYLFDPSTAQWRQTSPAPAGFYASARSPDIWTGTAVVTLTPEGVPLMYEPAEDSWHLGPAPDPSRQILPSRTPTVVVGGSLIVADGAYSAGGNEMRGPFTGTYRYTLPTAG